MLFAAGLPTASSSEVLNAPIRSAVSIVLRAISCSPRSSVNPISTIPSRESVIRHSLWAPTTPAERYLGLTEKILEAANGIAKDLINRSRK